MSRKEILIICLIFCCLFSLQAVAATSDGNSTDYVVLTTDSNVSAYSLPNLDNQLQAGSGNAGTFSDLQNDISHNGVIELSRNYTYSDADPISLKNGIDIPTTVTKIDGKGIVTIDANHQVRIFNVVSGHAVTLTGITFINGNATGNGGSINSNGIVTIENCNFINNTASNHGGAVYLEASDGDKITNCNFEGNVAGSNGGAVDWYAGSSNGVVSDSNFTNNTAKRSGGAIHWSGHYGTIKNSIFTDNNATGEVSSTIGGEYGRGDGGAVLWVGSHGIIDNCKFIDNNADRRGGAVYLHGNSTENCTNTTISNSTFTANIAGTNGGAIDWHEGASEGNILKSVFENNIAEANGGAVYWRGHNGEIKDSNFTNNTAKALRNGSYGNMGDGGAILWAGINGTVDNCRFIDNIATHTTIKNDTGRGGAVYIENCEHGNYNTTFTNSYFLNNTAGSNGGAIDWTAGAKDGYVGNCTFINNTAKRSGGAIHWSGHYGDIINSTFTNNTATGEVISEIGGIVGGGDGGAVLWVGSHGIIDNNCIFINNSASNRGGAIFLHGNSTENCTNVTIHSSIFEYNYAGTNGGAIDWHSGAHEGGIYNSTFRHNTAESNGGAVYWRGHHGDIYDSNFTNNTALGLHPGPYGNIGDGGAVFWAGINGTVDNCRFIDNEAVWNSSYVAGGRGGAVYLESCSHGNKNTSFKDVYFKNNIAGTNGGAIDWHEGAEDGLINNGTFINNTAKRNGGAIFWHGHNGTIKHSRFINNRATGEHWEYTLPINMGKYNCSSR